MTALAVAGSLVIAGSAMAQFVTGDATLDNLNMNAGVMTASTGRTALLLQSRRFRFTFGVGLTSRWPTSKSSIRPTTQLCGPIRLIARPRVRPGLIMGRILLGLGLG